MQMVELGEVAELLRNGASIKQSDTAGGTPITRIETIADWSINPERCGYADVTEDDYPNYLLQDGDILISHINSTKHLGKCAMYRGVPDKLIHGMNLLGLRVNSKVANPDYIYRVISSDDFRRQIPRITKNSVNQSSFTVTNFKTLQIPLPPLKEQKRIAAILDKADAIRRKRQQAIDLTDQLLSSVFVDMFGDPVTNPKGWEEKALKSLTSKIGSGATPRGGKGAYVEEGISLIRSLNIHDDKFLHKDLAHITDKQADGLSNVVVEEEDVLLNITGASVCRCSMVDDAVLPARVNQHVCIIRAEKEKLNPAFLLHYLISNSYKQKLLAMAGAGGATREALTKQQVENLMIAVPPVELQNQFEKIVEKIQLKKLKSNSSYQDMSKLSLSLTQRAFRGELSKATKAA